MDQSKLYRFYETDPLPVMGFLRYIHASRNLPPAASVLDMGCGTGRIVPLNRS